MSDIIRMKVRTKTTLTQQLNEVILMNKKMKDVQKKSLTSSGMIL